MHVSRNPNLFGSKIHLRVDSAETAMPEVRALLEKGGVTVRDISKIPFTLEDVFIYLVEERGEEEQPR